MDFREQFPVAIGSIRAILMEAIWEILVADALIRYFPKLFWRDG
uniref:Uncharacterized protein n=1 Tax=Candidatus Kentrum sp. TC TaxID=2126339 RepID=A0A450ZHQ8_9GAMM|nr:MAG: hypothetical protein BECKTC1821F_GA0114240_100298 [Candidatus Kentron sp. TC]